MSKYLGEDDLILNTSSRIPVCLCIDTSASMRRVIDGTGRDTGETEFVDGKHWRIVEGGKNLLDNMNEGLEAFYKAINSNEQAKLSCELAVVTFDDEARVLEDFGTLDKKRPVRISETGDNTALGEGISLALKLLETRKREYRKNGVDYYQPWLVIFTDGDASDSVAEARQKIRSQEEEKKLTVFTFALSDDVNMKALGELSRRRPISLKTDKLEEFFEWLGKSVSTVSMSQVGEKVKLDTSGMDDWAEI